MVVVRHPISSFGLATGRRRERSPYVISLATLTTASTVGEGGSGQEVRPARHTAWEGLSCDAA